MICKKTISVAVSVFAISGLLFTSCNKKSETKEKLNGQGGLDQANAPITYEQISDSKPPQLEYTAYRLRPGDMIGVLAMENGITQDTLISVNNIKQSRSIQAGDYIRIPSIPGILYTVRKTGETIDSISSKYEISAEKCAMVNSYGHSERLKAGTQLFLPDAELDWVTRQEINGDLFTRPLHGRYYFSSNWGWRSNPFSGKRSFHAGIDMAANTGTPVYAALAGRVVRVGYDNVYGNFVEVAHHSGYRTLYAHMNRITCSRGQYVSTSSKLGEVGSTGMSTGPHLHFAVYKNRKSQNPRLLWR